MIESISQFILANRLPLTMGFAVGCIIGFIIGAYLFQCVTVDVLDDD